mmetsp:Transcript_27608/g.39531  ORF Transcript_27608/g.39531 Transcript_27608/m.39531 type:complete len:310 (+) Transcript_27608:100-1029(+)|eukprot:CAMPEP_0201691238 /NCGR_PEP_ID=MMETSP0578-20130828/4447_1 /ASSEMBLY_ACC=CAM_ASM_000663 /TAXON_ID=267565 /ORGANISM="Skeletonema grethea, Strain CCMP 1804" /LENGTH=309 /DNA_ID=CAMNT_0048176399 /DNA_START=94 /DNA_END=1023 /DNA_ORIENTATION=-
MMQEGDDEIFVYTGGDVPLSVTRLRIDRSVKIVPDLAFSERENLLEVYLDEGVEKIGYGVFYNCSGLRRIKFPSTLRVIGMLAFGCCFNLEDAQLNNGLKLIQELAFSQCSSLKRLNIPVSLITLGKKAYTGCTSVKEVVLPARPGRPGIGYAAFSDCTSLERVMTPLNTHLMSTNHQIFSGCTKLEHVELIGARELVSSLCIELVKRTLLENEILRVNRVLPKLKDNRKLTKLHDWTESIYYKIESTKLVHNKNMKQALTSIELGLWKIKLDNDNVTSRNKRKRGQCRINCGADVVIKNVIPFLTFFK